MRVLAGGPARETESDVFLLHKEGLEGQKGFEIHVKHDVVPPLPQQEHTRWFGKAIERVAFSRQRMFEFADGYDGLLMVDTDVVMGPGVLEALWAVDAPVVYGVFWSVWPGYDKPLPQVWDEHPYGFRSRDLMKALVMGEPVEVYGGGACTLFRQDAFRSHYWPLIQGMPGGSMWGGEDRTYCLGCCFLGIKQMAVGGLPIVHLYTPEQQTPDALKEAREVVGL